MIHSTKYAEQIKYRHCDLLIKIRNLIKAGATCFQYAEYKSSPKNVSYPGYNLNKEASTLLDNSIIKRPKKVFNKKETGESKKTYPVTKIGDKYYYLIIKDKNTRCLLTGHNKEDLYESIEKQLEKWREL